MDDIKKGLEALMRNESVSVEVDQEDYSEPDYTRNTTQSTFCNVPWSHW